MGKYDGQIDGYNQASKEYESKLLEQADLFIQQKTKLENEMDAYEQLLNDYEVAISELENNLERTETENQLLQALLLKERLLKKLV